MTDVSKLFDAVVVGGGPAGLTAALYLARARYRVLVIEKDRYGGQITITDNVVNYPGIPSISGAELGERMRAQAEGFGAEFLAAEVTGLDMEGDIKTVSTTKGDIECFGVLLASGAHPKRVGFEGEEEFQGHGVAYCATCDGEFFTGKEVYVVGGGLAACEEALFLTRYASHVTMLVRKDHFRAEQSVVDQVEACDDIDVFFTTRIASVAGDTVLRSMVLEDTETGEQLTMYADPGDTFGIFVFVGYEPETALVEGLVELDEQGYVLLGEASTTSTPGLYAAGDVCQKSLRQVTTAVGQAATVATDMERYLKAMQEKTGIVPDPPVRTVQAMPVGEAEPELPDNLPDSDIFAPADVAEIIAAFDRMDGPLVLKLALDGSPVAEELEELANELARLGGKLDVRPHDNPSHPDLPYVEICDAEGVSKGMRFHGVPGGHEFNSFIVTLYNVAGPGQPIDDADLAAIEAIDRPVKLDLLVTLTCTNCPDVAMAVQRIAALNPNVTVDIYDANIFDALVDQYNVMGVPFLIVNDGEKTIIGRKGLTDILAELA
ncbi:MAG: FAD-dependent oxidoreductase [Coriobacteriales bacterium]|jgi:thioredoxin reductase (NADPH)